MSKTRFAFKQVLQQRADEADGVFGQQPPFRPPLPFVGADEAAVGQVALLQVADAAGGGGVVDGEADFEVEEEAAACPC